MYRLLKQAVEYYERKANKEILLGTKIAIAGLLLAFGGGAIARHLSQSVGSKIVLIGVFAGLTGMFIYAVGFFKYLAKGQKEEKRVKEKYENPK